MKTITSLAFSCLLLTSAPTSALTFGAGGYLQYVDYQEFNPDGSSPDRETGFLPGIKLDATYQHHRLWTSYAYGDVNYDGQLQSGTPYTTRTHYILSSIGYEYAHEVPQYSAITLLAGFGSYNWQRQVLSNHNIPSLNETYSWRQLHAGVRYRPASIFNLPLEFSISAIKTFDGTVDVNLSNLGYASPKLDLGNEYGFQAGIKYYKNISSKLRLSLSMQTSRRAFGRSQSKTVGNALNTSTVTEPRSVSWYSSIGLELVYKL